jgi:hypothetical protein
MNLGESIPALGRQPEQIRPVTRSEIVRYAGLVLLMLYRYQDLVAAARATLAAADDGEPDPLYYVRDELQAQGQLPDRRQP